MEVKFKHLIPGKGKWRSYIEIFIRKKQLECQKNMEIFLKEKQKENQSVAAKVRTTEDVYMLRFSAAEGRRWGMHLLCRVNMKHDIWNQPC